MIQARQVPPEYQSPYLDLDDYPEVILDGNRDYVAHTSKAYDAIKNNYWYALADILSEQSYFRQVEDVLYYFPPIGRDKYTNEEIEKIIEILLHGGGVYMHDLNKQETCELLSIVSGIEYDYTTIRGSRQSDWQNMYYPKAWGDAFVGSFECEYFNEGSEWIIDDDYSCYVHAWDEDDMRKELAEITGESEDNIAMFFFDGWERTAKYRAG